MTKPAVPYPQYATCEDISDTLDIPTPGDPNGETMIFTDETHPSRRQVEKLIVASEDEIDRRLHTSWRENVIEDILDIRTYQADCNGVRNEYYLNGGNVVNLHKNVREWNPFPIYEYFRNDDGEIILEPLHDEKTDEPLYVQERDGDIIYDENGDPKMEYVWIYTKKEGEEAVKTKDRHWIPLRDGERQWVLDSSGKQIVKLIQPEAPKYKRMKYPGDKLEIRRPMFFIPSLNNPDGNDRVWVDVSENINSVDVDSTPNAWFWFDYKSGRLFIRSYFLGTRNQALRIRYRWGSEEPVPMAINRLICLMVSIQILNGSAFALKYGSGGDMARVRDGIVRNWENEIGRILSSYQRAGTVHSWSR